MADFRAELRWEGSTGAGWSVYDRTHQATAPLADQTVSLTTGEALGDPRHLNPEQLLVMAASSCQLLWFLHLAAKARLDVRQYTDEASGEMPEGDPPLRITRIVLRPRIVVRGADSPRRVHRLIDLAHRQCYIANSLRCEITIQPTVEVAPGLDSP